MAYLIDTPASICEKLGVASNSRPEYSTVNSEGPSHDPRFTMSLKLFGLETTATAPTKKEAKQLCAHKMLQKLDETKPDIPNRQLIMSVWNRDLYSPEIVQPPAKGVDAPDFLNAIGKLAEYCSKKKLAQPYYEDQADTINIDYSHTFTVSCTIFHVLPEHQELMINGHGKQKKLAKQQAALNMIEKLQELGIDVNDVPPNREERMASIEVGRRAQQEHDQDRSGAIDSEIIINNELNGCHLDMEDDGLMLSPHPSDPVGSPESADDSGKDASNSSDSFTGWQARQFKIAADTDPVAQCFEKLRSMPLPLSANVEQFLTLMSQPIQAIGYRLDIKVTRLQATENEPAPSYACYLTVLNGTNAITSLVMSSYGIGRDRSAAQLNALHRFKLFSPAALVKVEHNTSN